jgi:hypothetical protein
MTEALHGEAQYRRKEIWPPPMGTMADGGPVRSIGHHGRLGPALPADTLATELQRVMSALLL